MKSYKNWKREKQFQEFNLANPVVNPTATPDASQAMTPATPQQMPVDPNGMSRLGSAQIPLNKTLQNLNGKPFQTVMAAKTQFDKGIQDLLQDKSKSSATRGARLGLMQARQAMKQNQNM